MLPAQHQMVDKVSNKLLKGPVTQPQMSAGYVNSKLYAVCCDVMCVRGDMLLLDSQLVWGYCSFKNYSHLYTNKYVHLYTSKNKSLKSIRPHLN